MYEGQSEEKKSSIRRAEEELYARNGEEAPIINSLSKKEYDIQDDWGDDVSERGKLYTQKKRSMVKNILIASLVFFIGAMVFAFYTIYGDKNLTSPESINMSVVGPVSVDAGKEVELHVLLENKNPANLLSTELFIDLPDGTRGTMGDQENVTRLVKSLGTVGPNVLINEKFNATFFGEENKEKKIYITLEYRFEGSGATLIKKTEHSVLIVSSQVGFTIDVLGEASSGQEIEIVASIDSSTSETLEGLLFEINYPFGFDYTGAEPEPMFGETTWVLDSLKPFASQEIRIRGIISGEDDNNKVFTANLGAQDKQDPRRLETIYSRVEESVIIKRPFIGVQVLINRQDATEAVIIEETDKVYVSIPWVNNLDTKIIDMGIEARINHPVVDRSSIVTTEQKGFYRSLDDVVIWDQRTNPELAVVLPGASGVVGFTFELGSIVQDGKLLENAEIEIEATAKGRRLSDVNIAENIKTPAVGKVRLLTSLDLVARSLHNEGLFVNTGPLPPKVNTETTYTIKWQITNGTSKVSNTVVRTTLPTYVSWKGAVSPESESVLYNELGGEVVWSAGEIPAGAGVTKPPVEVSFKVGFIPSLTQVGTSPSLITNTTLTAIDDFTSSVVSDTESPRTIELVTESTFDISKQGKVVR